MEGHLQLMEIARAETGLDEWGEPSFREGLERLVSALNGEARLNALGDQVLRERILGHLRQRLLIEDCYRRYPELEQQQLNSPLFGVSLPRTGSTALSFLLAQDPRARSLRRLEAAMPYPPPCLADGARVDRDAAMQRSAGLKPHVPSGDDAPAECQDLMALDFRAHIFQAFAQIPSYSRWLLNADLSSTYRYHRRALSLLQWRMPALPWRLKCPTHLIYLADLDRAFPEARFVMTHRDPGEVMQSVVDVYADIVGRFTDHLDRDYLTELNVEQWSEGMRRALAFRAAGNDGRFYDIHFRAMERDPVGQVRGLYRWLAEPVDEAFESAMARWWQANAQRREPASASTSESLDLASLRPRFADYLAKMSDWTRSELA